MAVPRLLMLGLVSSLLVASIGTAQNTSANEASDKPQEAQPADQSPEQQLTQIVENFRRQYAPIRAKLRSADTREEANEELQALTEDCVKKVQSIAEENADAAVGFKAMEALLSQFPTPPETKEWVKQRILENYANNKATVPSIVVLGRDPQFLKQLLETTENREVRGVALYYQMMAKKGRELTEENAAEVMPIMERIVSEFGDVDLVYPGGRVRGTLGSLLDNEIFAFKHLRIGKVAPNIEGKDVYGESIQLTDYVGKVVVIDFWGDW